MANSLLGMEPTKMPSNVKKKPEKPPISPNSAIASFTTRWAISIFVSRVIDISTKAWSGNFTKSKSATVSTDSGTILRKENSTGSTKSYQSSSWSVTCVSLAVSSFARYKNGLIWKENPTYAIRSIGRSLPNRVYSIKFWIGKKTKYLSAKYYSRLSLGIHSSPSGSAVFSSQGVSLIIIFFH